MASLLASSIYFYLTPLGQTHSELLARTQPNIYDVIIALVGRLAGIVAISFRRTSAQAEKLTRWFQSRSGRDSVKIYID